MTKRKRGSEPCFKLPVFSWDDVCWEELRYHYRKNQVVLVKGPSKGGKMKKWFGMKGLKELTFKDGTRQKISSSFTIENKSTSSLQKASTLQDFMNGGFLDQSKGRTRRSGSRIEDKSSWYASWIVPEDILSRYLEELPCSTPTFFRQASHSDGLWVFVGTHLSSADTEGDRASRRCRRPPLTGRTEHTDSIDGQGTWHFQASGSKIWKV